MVSPRLASATALLLLLYGPGWAPADEPGGDDAGATRIEDISIEDLLKAPVEVASLRPATLRESPGIITVVTREEILDSGARDLLDVLALVPGFWPGMDVDGVASVGFRGVWGHEGKILLLIDGVEMNETLYSTLQLGNHYPVDNIQRIEIIRGPGSAIYGGFAELAVINVVTLGAEDLKGVSANARYGQLREDYGRRSLGACYGDDIPKVTGLSVSACLTIGQGHRSDRDYHDFYGNSYPLTRDGKLDPLFLNIGVAYKASKLRLIYDGFTMTERDGYGESKDVSSEQGFKGFYATLEHTLPLKKDMTLTPRLFFKRQYPWQLLDKTQPDYYDKTADRYGLNVTWSWDMRPGLNVLAGAELTRDHAFLNEHTGGLGAQTQFGTSDSVSYTTVAGFAQVLWSNPLVNVAAGVRVERHSEFGASLAPRLALTRIFGRYHLKALASTAFRAPGIENINDGIDVKPEHTHVYELEAGAALGDNAFVSVNAFDQTIDDPIIYYYDPAQDIDGYINYAQTGSRGLELDLRVRGAPGYARVSASYYYPAGKNQVDLYDSGDPDRLLAFPSLKVAAAGKLQLGHGLSLNPAVVFSSRVRGYLTGDGAGTGFLGEIRPEVVTDLFVAWESAIVKGLRVQAGGHNLTDEPIDYVQPYNGGHAPLPGPSRELMLFVQYDRPL